MTSTPAPKPRTMKHAWSKWSKRAWKVVHPSASGGPSSLQAIRQRRTQAEELGASRSVAW